ncbi:MAG: hypothetical protein AB1505_21305 [Candidatus Latescibacterota bacterium]
MHAHNRQVQLVWWVEYLGLKTLADLPGILPRVEAAVRDVLKAGQTGKTAANKVEGLRGFCIWAEKRGYLAANPLKGFAPGHHAADHPASHDLGGDPEATAGQSAAPAPALRNGLRVRPARRGVAQPAGR